MSSKINVSAILLWAIQLGQNFVNVSFTSTLIKIVGLILPKSSVRDNYKITFFRTTLYIVGDAEPCHPKKGTKLKPKTSEAN